MNVLTTSTPGRKRQMVFVPEINPHSFLFFFEKGTSGYSYSLRDYSIANHVAPRYAKDFGSTADDVRRKARHIYDAPFLDVARLSDWHSYTVALNELHGLGKAAVLEATVSPVVPAVGIGSFPILNRSRFDVLRKAAKTGDVRRILDSPNSEDWVTWNLLHLIQASLPDTWWKRLCARAKQANPRLRIDETIAAPSVTFWRTVPSPREYEAASRQCMGLSADPVVAVRSRDPRPVEGDSEIDIIYDSPSLLMYVEAKLDSDISMRTTYDANRNQIVRNIDCLLDSARGRTPYFWMFVRDVSGSRAYTQLMRTYQEDPKTLARLLPHRDPQLLQNVSEGLTLLAWRDIAEGICEPQNSDDEQVRFIKAELWRRIQ